MLPTVLQRAASGHIGYAQGWESMVEIQMLSTVVPSGGIQPASALFRQPDHMLFPLRLPVVFEQISTVSTGASVSTSEP